jgi:type IV pilus assembly protein PilE
MEAAAMKRINDRSRHRGVTLMELMVVMVVISILAAIAIPSYRQYVIRVTRTDGKRELLSMAGRLERCFTRTNNYTTIDGTLPCVTLPLTVPEGTYVVTGDITATAFTLSATPQGGQAADADCKIFTINQLGAQSISGGTGTAAGCWAGRRN